jgi:hypothetical protein
MMSGMPLDSLDDYVMLVKHRNALLASIGVSLALGLFLLERFKKHILFMPAFLFIPMALFWIIAASTHTSTEHLQEIGFIFPSTETVPFYDIWVQFRWSDIQWVSISLSFMLYICAL